MQHAAYLAHTRTTPCSLCLPVPTDKDPIRPLRHLDSGSVDVATSSLLFSHQDLKRGESPQRTALDSAYASPALPLVRAETSLDNNKEEIATKSTKRSNDDHQIKTKRCAAERHPTNEDTTPPHTHSLDREHTPQHPLIGSRRRLLARYRFPFRKSNEHGETRSSSKPSSSSFSAFRRSSSFTRLDTRTHHDRLQHT